MQLRRRAPVSLVSVGPRVVVVVVAWAGCCCLFSAKAAGVLDGTFVDKVRWLMEKNEGPRYGRP